MPRAVALAEQLELLSGEPTEIHPLEPLPAEAHSSSTSPTWSVEQTTPPLPLQVAVIHMWERKMLSLEYRWRGCRFLGWTTHELPALSDRRSPAVADATSADGRAPSQRRLVEASLLRRPHEAAASSVALRRETRPLR
jgi:hypothetical protein